MNKTLGQNSVKGTEVKLNINMEKIDGYGLDTVDFFVEVFTETGFKSVRIDKRDAIRVDEDNYIIRVDTAELGAGRYWIRLTALLPDSDFPDGYRTEKRTAFSGVTIDAQ